MSSISFMANLISLIAVGSSTSLHFALEAIILVIEFFCLLLLYYSISHNTPKFMKPYMIFGVSLFILYQHYDSVYISGYMEYFLGIIMVILFSRVDKR